MSIISLLKKRLKYLAFILFSIAIVVVVLKLTSRTRIAVINMPEYMYVKMAKSNDSYFIKIQSFKPDDLPDLKSYDMIMVFGMGMNLPAEQETKLTDAIAQGVPIFVFHAGASKIQTSNIEGLHLDAVTDYFENGGRKNFMNLLHYIRKEIDGKKLFAVNYEQPNKYASDLLFYLEEDDVFETVSEFEQFCLKNKYHKTGAKKVALFTSVPGPFNANRDHLNSIILEFQNRGYNVYPISSGGKRIEFLKQINPSAILYMPHGRFASGPDVKSVENELVQLNVPIICPVSVLMKHDEWIKHPQGMSGGFLSQSIAMPEFDGGIIPYALVAQYEDENGLLVFKTIPERLPRFVDLVDKYVTLKSSENKDKKVAIIYYKGHGKGAGEAAGMEVMPSIYYTLKRLHAEGYNVGVLPINAEAFEKDLSLKAPLLGPYAEGAFDAYLKTGYARLVKKETYEQWCKEQMPAELYSEVVTKYGAAPGSYMAVSEDNGEYLAVSCAQYGNIVVMPQPMPGLGENSFELVHGAKVAPPHSYIAPYLWLQKEFKTDAIIHFGTHGSLEFTPGKQVALSNYDWADVLIGTTPHFYPYISNDPGEAVMAKRRAYATTLSHVTPPFIESMVLSNKKAIRDKIAQYEQTNGNLKQEYAKSAKAIAIAEGYAKDLGLDTIASKPYSEKEMLKLINYLDEMDNERITAGLYTMGIPYQEKHIASTVMLMSSNEIAYSLMELDKLKGKIKSKQTENKFYFTNTYLAPAKARVTKIYQSANTDQIFKETIADTDYQRALRWQKHNESPKGGKAHAHASNVAHPKPSANLEQLIVKIAAHPKQKKFVERLNSAKEYERAMGLLDPQTRASAKRIAVMIPAMREAIEVAEDENIQQLLRLIADTVVKAKALRLINDPSLEKRINAEKVAYNKKMLSVAKSDSMLHVLGLPVHELEKMDVYALKSQELKLDFYAHNRVDLLQLTNSKDKLQALLQEGSINKTSENFNHILISKVDTETAFSNAVFAVKHAYDNIALYRQQLSATPQAELDAIMNALNGGFIAPSPGGDPLTNPATLPTGRNLYSINAEKTPTKEAWKVGQMLVTQMLEDYKSKNDKYPLKVSYTLWSSEFIESEGATLAQIFYLLGVEPIWDAFGNVKDLRIIPANELNRPRIDVVVQTSGQLRDIASSRLYLIQKAVNMIATEDDKAVNYIKKGVLDAKKRLLEKGFSPKEAEELSKSRVFGGINGSYGAGNFTSMVEKGDAWDSTSSLANNYLNNMGASYGDENAWGQHSKGVFEAALLNTEAVVQPRQSNTWGPLSLDHMYEFMGGMNAAVQHVTGNDAESYLSDYRNPSNPRMQGLKEGIWSEARTTLLNPRYIKEYMNGGSSAAETFAETFRNTYGWNATKPSVIENRLWNEYYETYIKDAQKLGIHKFFESQNPYALQEMTAVMLETVRKGMWKASDEQVNEMVKLHTKLVVEYDAGCSGFVCDNAKLRKMIAGKLSPADAKAYNGKIENALSISEQNKKNSKVLKKEEKDKLQKPNEPLVNKSSGTWAIIGLGILAFVAIIVLLRIKNKKKDA